jgi:hypothetical protein
MGVVSKDQELAQDLLQKMIDKLAEPFSGRNAGKSIGVRLKEMNDTFVVKPVQSPFEDLSRRAQTRSLLDGVRFLRAGLEELQEVVGMRDEDGEPSALDEVLRRVLQHGAADARGGNASNRLGLTSAMIPEHMVEEIRSEALEDAAYECRYGNVAAWAKLHDLTAAQLRAVARVLPAGWVPRYEELQEYHGTTGPQTRAVATPETGSALRAP